MATKNLVISVESRKGGVGKTTAALSLAKIFRDKGYCVLFLDLDLTGTNITDQIGKKYWAVHSEILKYNIDNNELNGKNIDVVELFEKVFMIDKTTINSKYLQKDQEKLIKYYPNKINIIGSEIYNPKDRLGNNILFDEMHSFWFVEFLREIYFDFIFSCNNQNTVIVLDNSPGYIGFVQNIHEWLTDLGPENGKFMIVSSFDKQDLIACSKHIEEIHQIFLNKYNVVKKALENNKDVLLSEEDLKFYLKLDQDNYKLIKSVEKDSASELAFYQDRIIKKIEFKTVSPHSYIGFVINKAMTGIINGNLEYNFSFIKSSTSNYEDSYFQHLLNYNANEFFINRIIPFDEYIEYQFMMDSITRKYVNEDDTTPEKILIEQIENYRPLIKENQFWNEGNIQNDSNYLYESIKVLNEYQKRFDLFLTQINSIGLDYLSRLFNIAWQPISIGQKLEKELKLLITSKSLFIKSKVVISNDDLQKDNEIRILMELFEKVKYSYDKSQQFVFDILSKSMVCAFFFAGGSKVLGKYSKLLQVEILLPILRYQMKRFEDKKIISSNELGRFFAREELNENKLKYLMNPNLEFSERNNYNIKNFYSAMSKTQARIIDLNRDFDFLLLVMFSVLRSQKNKDFALPYIRSILNKVIINKTISHKEAKKKLSHEIKSFQYLEEFLRIMELQTKSWLYE